MKLKESRMAYYFFAFLMMTCAVYGQTSRQNSKAVDLGRVETGQLVFYFPRGYEPTPRILEKGTVFHYYNRGNSINAIRFGHLAGKVLNQQLCQDIAQLFDESELRIMANASEAKGVTFSSEDGVSSCYYYYNFDLGKGRSRLEHKIHQRGDSPAYAVTAVYAENSPEQASLQKALHSFALKKDIALTPAPSTPHWVIVQQEEDAYTTYLSILGDVPEEKFEEVKSRVDQEEGTILLSWEEFQHDIANYTTVRIVINDYPDSQVVKGIITLLERFPGTLFGLAWNGGVVFTYNDYQYARKRYQQYLANPEEYIPERDPRVDPINPIVHFGPLLGW